MLTNSTIVWKYRSASMCFKDGGSQFADSRLHHLRDEWKADLVLLLQHRVRVRCTSGGTAVVASIYCIYAMYAVCLRSRKTEYCRVKHTDLHTVHSVCFSYFFIYECERSACCIYSTNCSTFAWCVVIVIYFFWNDLNRRRKHTLMLTVLS